MKLCICYYGHYRCFPDVKESVYKNISKSTDAYAFIHKNKFADQGGQIEKDSILSINSDINFKRLVISESTEPDSHKDKKLSLIREHMSQPKADARYAAAVISQLKAIDGLRKLCEENNDSEIIFKTTMDNKFNNLILPKPKKNTYYCSPENEFGGINTRCSFGFKDVILKHLNIYKDLEKIFEIYNPKTISSPVTGDPGLQNTEQLFKYHLKMHGINIEPHSNLSCRAACNK